jgi:hypothetical protein
MTQKCHHCGAWHKNKQAIRAHLKHCEIWKTSEAKELRDQADLLRKGAAPTYPVRRVRSVVEILGTSTRQRELPMCAECGVRTARAQCACGGTRWLDAKSEPRKCPACARWIATARRTDWNGRCGYCGCAISEDALRRENDDLRARLGNA